jgi:hypothetical protein
MQRSASVEPSHTHMPGRLPVIDCIGPLGGGLGSAAHFPKRAGRPAHPGGALPFGQWELGWRRRERGDGIEPIGGVFSRKRWAWIERSTSELTRAFAVAAAGLLLPWIQFAAAQGNTVINQQVDVEVRVGGSGSARTGGTQVQTTVRVEQQVDE